MGKISTRRKHTPKYKANAAVDAIRERKTLTALSVPYAVSPVMISKWKRIGMDGMPTLCESQVGRSKKKKPETEPSTEDLYVLIGKLQVENACVKKKFGQMRDSKIKRALIEMNATNG